MAVKIPCKTGWVNYKEPTPNKRELCSGASIACLIRRKMDSGSKKRSGWYPPCRTRFFVTPSWLQGFLFLVNSLTPHPLNHKFQIVYPIASGQKFHASMAVNGLTLSCRLVFLSYPEP